MAVTYPVTRTEPADIMTTTEVQLTGIRINRLQKMTVAELKG